MGLDQYVFRVSKPKVEPGKVYKFDEMPFGIRFEAGEKDNPEIKEVVPFCEHIKCEREDLNLEEIVKSLGYPEETGVSIGAILGDTVVFYFDTGKTKTEERKHTFSRDELARLSDDEDLEIDEVVKMYNDFTLDFANLLVNLGYPKDTVISNIAVDNGKAVITFTVTKPDEDRREFKRSELKPFFHSNIYDYLVADATEVAYWRKEYDISDWFYARLDDLDNITYKKLSSKIIKELEGKDWFPCDSSIEYEETEDGALYYYEWY